MPNGDAKRRRVILKWVMYAALAATLTLMVTVVDPHERAGERIAFTFGAFITLALYSFLFGENELYRFVEHLLVGIMAAQTFVMGLEQQLYPKWYLPMREGIKAALDLRFDPRVLWLIAPFFGAFWYMIYSKRYLWLSRLIAGFIIGAGVGGIFEANFKNIVTQAGATFKPLAFPTNPVTAAGVLEMVTNLVFIVCVLVVLFYFVFTFRFADSPFARPALSAGRLVMMVAFGVLFGTIVGTRMGLVIDRIYFLVVEWAKPIVASLVGG